MIRINMHSEIVLEREGLPESVERIIKDDLKLDNPKYITAAKHGYSTSGLSRFIKLYIYSDNYLTLPRGYIYRLLSIIKDMGESYTLVDNTLTLPSVKFKSRIKLRSYQQNAVNRLVTFKQGGLVGGCGSGKTEMMLEAMARIGQRSLWVTHTRELANQVTERACRCFSDITAEEIGFIGEGKVSVGDKLTVALVQTLSKIDMEPILNQFGALFIDEGHHISADSFYNPIGRFPAKYRIWASATPFREDGLTKMVIASAGPILATINQCDLPTIVPRLQVIETGYIGTVDAEDYSGMVSELITDPGRNRLIIDVIKKEAYGHYSLILSDRIEHLETLKEILIEHIPELTAEILVGKMSKKERLAVMERAKNREIDILLATQLAREGLDLPHLDRLFLATPKKAAGAVQQEAGRIMRPCEGKTDAVIFDFWDENPIFKAQFWKRRQAYKQLGIDVNFKNMIQTAYKGAR